MEIAEVRALLVSALEGLFRAVEDLLAPTVPETPLPRPRTFEIAPGVVWPAKDGWDYVSVFRSDRYLSYLLEYRSTREDIARVIIAATGAQPRGLLRALRRIEAATAWCRARRAGRERMAQEILRQQARAVEKLEAEIVWRALR